MAAADEGTQETVDLAPEPIPLPPQPVERTPEPVERTPEPVNRTPELVRQEIEAERERLVAAVAELRGDLDRAKKKVTALKSKLPAAAVVGVGIGATMRYLTRRRHRR
jgi:hypothetical protein